MTQSTLRIHHIEPVSGANGPGKRLVIWLQGCSLNCNGCFNPQTHDSFTGELWAVSDLLGYVRDHVGLVEGITISGGEPLQQIGPLVEFLTRVRSETDLSILLFSGYDWEEIQRMPLSKQLLSCLDVLLAGRFDSSRRIAYRLIGSLNKSTHFLTGRYSANDLNLVPEAEVILSPGGEILISGIDPLNW